MSVNDFIGNYCASEKKSEGYLYVPRLSVSGHVCDLKNDYGAAYRSWVIQDTPLAFYERLSC